MLDPLQGPPSPSFFIPTISYHRFLSLSLETVLSKSGKKAGNTKTPPPSESEKVPWERLAPAIESLVKAGPGSRSGIRGLASGWVPLGFVPLGFGFRLRASGGADGGR